MRNPVSGYLDISGYLPSLTRPSPPTSHTSARWPPAVYGAVAAVNTSLFHSHRERPTARWNVHGKLITRIGDGKENESVQNVGGHSPKRLIREGEEWARGGASRGGETTTPTTPNSLFVTSGGTSHLALGSMISLASTLVQFRGELLKPVIWPTMRIL